MDAHVHVLQRLRENDPTITNLDLTRNDINDQGAEALAAALQHNTTLTSLDLQHNYIGHQGAEGSVTFHH